MYAPSFISVSNITTTSAKIKFGAVAGATKYKIWYKTSASSAWKKTTASGLSKVIKSLIPGTMYDVKVQGICGAGTGPFTSVMNFTTLVLKDDGSENNHEAFLPSETNLDFTLYPNPARDLINISFERNMNAEYKIEIYNNVGQSVFMQSGTVMYSVQLETGLPAGIYFMLLDCNGSRGAKKFVITK